MRDLTPFILQSTTPNARGDLVLDRPAVAADLTVSSGGVLVPLHMATSAIIVSSKSVLVWDADAAKTVAQSQAVGPISYSARIKDVADIRFSRGSAPEGGALTLINLDYVFTGIIGSLEDLLDTATVVLYLCFRKADGTYEAEPLLTGEVQNPKGDLKQCTLDVVSDMSSSSASAGSRELTQRCAATAFGDAICGHTAHDPGDDCSMIYDDAVRGCAFWRWQHRFFGVPTQIASDPALVVGDPLIDRNVNGGWDVTDIPTRRGPLDPDRLPFLV